MPSILGYFSVGSLVLLISMVSLVLYSAGSGVNRVVIVLSVFSSRSLSFVHWCILFRYGCILSCAFLWNNN